MDHVKTRRKHDPLCQGIDRRGFSGKRVRPGLVLDARTSPVSGCAGYR